MSYKSLALDILKNQDKYRVNRAEKMERTVEVMVNNINKKRAQSDGQAIERDDAEVRGYGLNKNTGD
jgi:hypothetical protein